MNRIRYIFFSVLLFLIGAGVLSCKKEVADPDSSNPNVLPPLTHEGKNTFGCKVNGEVWVAQMPFSVGGASEIETEYYPDLAGVQIVARKKDEDKNIFERLTIVISGFNGENSYLVETMNNELGGFSDFNDNYDCWKYFYHDSLIRNVKVSYFSSSSRIISGTFEMDLVNPSCPGDTIKIREGRFDCSY
ncbi:hypothetical protein GCM10009118_13430 [Wandonia haliotis]|uniref:Lipoprotein n=1 Tax=Wandonia haliotis TaxID=574963 RepID=A0ABN1MNR7_9FLAO